MTDDIEQSKRGSLGKLHDLFDSAFPAHRTRLGFLGVTQISAELGTTSQNLYKWFKKEKLPAKYVTPLVTLSKGKLTVEKLLPFVI